MVVEGVDHRVAAAALRFRRNLGGEDAPKQRAQRGQPEQEPRPERVLAMEGDDPLPVGPQGHIAGQVFQNQALHQLQPIEEAGPHHPASAPMSAE